MITTERLALRKGDLVAIIKEGGAATVTRIKVGPDGFEKRDRVYVNGIASAVLLDDVLPIDCHQRGGNNALPLASNR